jgi:hypothetical protein
MRNRLKGKAIPIEACIGPWESRKLKLSEQSAHEGDKVVSPKYRPPF